MYNNTLFFTVVDRGRANNLLHKIKEIGAEGGTILLGESTVRSRLLDLLGENKIHKEILMVAIPDCLDEKIHDTLFNKPKLSKRNANIAFSVPLKRYQTASSSQVYDPTHKIIDYPYYCIMIIVDKGRSKECIRSARAAGARTNTIIHARGAGIPKDYYFSLIIEPQKEIVMILASKDKVVQIKERLLSDLELEKPGNGILFIHPVCRTSGLFETKNEKPRQGVIS
jgi:nitrogen regulatory protein PII